MKRIILIGLLYLITPTLQAKTIIVSMYTTAQPPQSLGEVKMQDTRYGLLITPKLHGIPPGLYGFHVHNNPSCADAGEAAGGHYDPAHTDQHQGPYRATGHLGDLPSLYVDAQGQTTLPVLAPRLTTADLYGHSLMIHAGGDNYSDYPKKLGGGGKRIACGVILNR